MLENDGKPLEKTLEKCWKKRWKSIGKNAGKMLENALKTGKARKCAGANAGPRNLSALQRPSGAFQYSTILCHTFQHRVKLALIYVIYRVH